MNSAAALLKVIWPLLPSGRSVQLPSTFGVVVAWTRTRRLAGRPVCCAANPSAEAATTALGSERPLTVKTVAESPPCRGAGGGGAELVTVTLNEPLLLNQPEPSIVPKNSRVAPAGTLMLWSTPADVLPSPIKKG